MKTLLEILRRSQEYLGDRRAAEDVVSSALGMKRLDLYLAFDRPLTEGELEQCRRYLKRRKSGEPIQYIEGKVEFCGCDIGVSPDVLIPRPETELLVEKVQATGTVWDICCGSGCIGIALKKRFPDATVVMSDISPKAAAVARDNVKRNGLDIEVRVGDLFEPFAGEMADVIVSNPPYVTENEYQTLQQEVMREPKLALVGGATGLEIYLRIAQQLDTYLKPGGKGYFEIGDRRVGDLFECKNKLIECDLSGLPRFFSIEKAGVTG